MYFNPGDRVEIISGLHKHQKNCFVQRAATPEDNHSGLDRSGQYLVNFGHSTFTPGWEAGIWVDPDSLRRIDNTQAENRMKHLVSALLRPYITEQGMEHRILCDGGRYKILICQSEVNHFELTIEERAVGVIHDSVPFASFFDALTAADEMIGELKALTSGIDEDWDAYIGNTKNADGTANLDGVHQLLNDISEPLDLPQADIQEAVNLGTEWNSQSDVLVDERAFLTDLIDNPLPVEFEKHLKRVSFEAFQMFKREGFVELVLLMDRWRVTNKGRERLGLKADPLL